MIKLLYTGASNPNQEQKKPQASLGGFISSTPVPNASQSNLFGGVSLLSESNKPEDTVMIAVQNLWDKAISKVTVWFDNPEGTYAGMKIAVVKVSKTENGCPIFEKIESMSAKPYYADFYEATAEAKLVVSGLSVAISDYFGIWITRSVKDLSSERTCDKLYENDGKEVVKDEVIKLQIQYE